MANYNHCRVKMHHSYTFEEVAVLFGVHKNTVAGWVKKGLPCLKQRKPYLILGKELRLFLQDLRQSKKQKCKADELYCMGCKKPQKPMGLMVDYLPINDVKGRLIGLCECCERPMNRFANAGQLDDMKRHFDVSIE
ncbi:MAG: helix-turn-helix domain-containing protein [Pseudomonadales bacterium]|nr:helix-turn-helix domain-containing protein [Pseudomonadales bacterium]